MALGVAQCDHRPPDPRQPSQAIGQPSPLQELEASELRRRLADCLGRLPGSWGAVIALRGAESHSYDEIASTLGPALRTVRSLLARARLAPRRGVEGGS